MKIAGAILAGGKAKRLNGIAKGNIKIYHKTIIENLIEAFNFIGINDIVISSNDPDLYKQYHKPVISDRKKNIGPLGGIETVLAYFKIYNAVIFVPCDLPNITGNELLILKNAFNTNITYVKTNEHIHPLCVVIPTNKLYAISNIINDGEKKVLNAWNKLNAKVIYYKDENKFFNINNEKDIKRINF
jgi:molybdopterin-guanine dinucleotide biosynthesis protein A